MKVKNGSQKENHQYKFFNIKIINNNTVFEMRLY